MWQQTYWRKKRISGKFRASESSGFFVPLMLPSLRNNPAALTATRVWLGAMA